MADDSRQEDGGTDRPKALRQAEQEIAAVDAELQAIVARRVELTRAWAEHYRQWRPAAMPLDYWAELAAPSSTRGRGPENPSIPAALTRDAWRAVDREVRAVCVAAVVPLRVVYLGPEYSYSHLAALERFGRSLTLDPVATIAAVFDEVTRGKAEFGVVPLENSTDGRIADTLDVFARVPTRVCGEVQLRIHHCLWGAASLAEIREVQSKPQALSQCRNWLARHLPDAQCIPAASTTAAAQHALQHPEVAAVASRAAGEALGLKLLAENIEDRPDNVTRFAVIGSRVNPRTGQDKTTLMFELAHRPGALADAMLVFKKNRLNLTWIESFPKPGSPQEYLFFVEFLGHEDDPRAMRALRDLSQKTSRQTVLGSYPAGAPV